MADNKDAASNASPTNSAASGAAAKAAESAKAAPKPQNPVFRMMGQLGDHTPVQKLLLTSNRNAKYTMASPLAQLDDRPHHRWLLDRRLGIRPAAEEARAKQVVRSSPPHIRRNVAAESAAAQDDAFFGRAAGRRSHDCARAFP